MHNNHKVFFDLSNNLNNYFKQPDSSIDTNQLFDKANNSMFEVLKIIVNLGNYKDKFEYSYYTVLFGFMVQATSTKTKTTYSFSCNRFEDNFTFKSFITHHNHIRNLKDDFLLDFFSACINNKYEYIENTGFNEEKKLHPQLFKPIKSIIFRLMRNHIFRYNNEYDIGYFLKEWSIKKPIESIIEEAAIAMKYFYKLNYNLWKKNPNPQ